MKANRFFLDTAYVLALLNPKDTYHKYAKAMLPSMHSAHEVWLTEAVLIEIANALASSNRSAAVAFIKSTVAFTADDHFQQAGFRALLLE